MSENSVGRVASDRAGGADAPEPVPVSALPGTHPSRVWRTDLLPFDERPIYQFVLVDGYQEHSGQQWSRRWVGTATIAQHDARFGYRREDIDRIQRDGDMLVVERVVGWLPAEWPSLALFRDSDGSGEAGETGTGSTEGDSAGRNGIAQDTSEPSA